MGKLKFKSTELEREAREFSKQERAKRKERERAERYADDEADAHRGKRRRASPDARLDEQEYERMLREAEDKAFRAKLFDELAMDDELDGVHTMMGDYHVPDRWATGSHAVPADPKHMTDDEYAEWVREGMWR